MSTVVGLARRTSRRIFAALEPDTLHGERGAPVSARRPVQSSRCNMECTAETVELVAHANDHFCYDRGLFIDEYGFAKKG